MSSTVDHAAFMARPREEPSSTHPTAVSAAPSAPMGSTLPPFSASNSKPSLNPSNARAPEPPTAPEPAKITELPKPVTSETKPATNAGISLPSISNLDAPPQPPKETAGEAPNGANAASAPALTGSTKKPNGAAAPPATTGFMSTLNKPVDAAAPAPAMSSLSAPSFPRPVEVKSVPDTPVNTGTPAGGTPRPVLDISQEPIQKLAAEGAKPTSTSVNEVGKPELSLNGAAEKSAPAAPAPTSAPATAAPSAPAGQKRKLENDTETRADSEQSEKKAKLEEAAKPGSNGATDAALSAPAPSGPRKVGRPKKSKTPAPVGRTQRKTRSQGNVEGGL